MTHTDTNKELMKIFASIAVDVDDIQEMIAQCRYCDACFNLGGLDHHLSNLMDRYKIKQEDVE